MHTLPAGPYQRDRGPSQWLLRMLATQTERTELVPLIDALHARMRAEKVMDFGMQMASAARLASTFPQVGEQLRQRFRVVLLDEYQDTGHAQRVALSSLFGGGVDDELALTAVGDPIQSIYGWRGASATNLPRFTTDFPRADGTPGAHAGAAHQLAQSAAGAASGQRGVRRGAAPFGRGAGRCGRGRAPSRAPSGAHCWPTSRPNGTGSQTIWRSMLPRGPQRRVPPRRRRRCWCAATPTPRRWPTRLRPAACRSRSSALAGLLAVPEVADVVAMLRLVADPTAGAAAMRVLTGPRWRLGGRDIAALWRRAVELDDRPTHDATHRADRRAGRRRTPTRPAWPTRSAIPGRRQRIPPPGIGRIVALGRELTALRAHLTHPLPDLVAEVRRVLGVDAEVRAARPVGIGLVGHRAPRRVRRCGGRLRGRAPGATVPSLLAYLDAAEQVENGLAPAEVDASSPTTGCRSSPCTPPRAWSGRWSRCRT